MAAKFEIFQDARGEYRFRLKTGNGEIVATGERGTPPGPARSAVLKRPYGPPPKPPSPADVLRALPGQPRPGEKPATR